MGAIHEQVIKELRHLAAEVERRDRAWALPTLMWMPKAEQGDTP